MNIIAKHTDCDCVTNYHWFGKDFSFEVDIVSACVFVTFNRKDSDGTEEKAVEIVIDFNLEDIHDYIFILNDGEDFENDVWGVVMTMMEEYIEEFLSSGETVLDLNIISSDISERISRLGAEYVEKRIQSKKETKASE